MNTNKLKTFSKNARIILLKGVKQRIAYWGFDKKGNVTEELTSIEGGYMFRESVFNDPTVAKKWNALKSAVKRHTVEDIIEEAAYTWFNRLIAIKILEKNKYIDPVYEYVSDQLKDPLILQKARKGELTKLREDEKKLLNEYLIESKDEEAFGLLLTAYCRTQKLTNRIFGHIDDYTELLLPNNLLSGGGIVEHINSNDAIEEEDYKEVELIGWLYQFYISDKKEEVFAGFKNKKKARPEDIPAATQIFTPKWIVKYMVENTVGRIWLDLHPDSPIRSEMKYFVEPADKENYKPETIIKSVTELSLMDPASGSGHILVEGFDLIMKMYLEEGYSTKNAVESILKKNLYGLDIDDRAAQLANFAVLLKATKYYPALLTSDILPNIYSFPESRELPQAEVNLFLDKEEMQYGPKLKEILNLLEQGKNLGSVIKIEMPVAMRQYVIEKYKYYEGKYITDELDLAEKAFWVNFRSFIQVMLSLSEKYTSVVANPPYMGQKNMNDNLKEYVNKQYPISKSDLMTVFMEVFPFLLVENGKYSFITPPSWMFLSTFEELRESIIKYSSFDSLLHLSRGIFGADFGSVCTVITKKIHQGVKGTYFKLIERTFQEFYQGHLEILFLKANKDNAFRYKFSEYSKEQTEFDHSDDGLLIYYPDILQSNFSKIPGVPIAYWVSSKVLKLFEYKCRIMDVAVPKTGMTTANNDLFTRLWYEVSQAKTHFNCDSSKQASFGKRKWFPYAKGGGYRKWSGYNEYVINWYNAGYEIKNYKDAKGKKLASVRNEDNYFSSSISWSAVSSYKFSTRVFTKGYLFDSGGSSLFPKNDEQLYHIQAFLCSPIADKLLQTLNPTLNFQPGNVGSLPLLNLDDVQKSRVIRLAENNVNISRQDWNSRETSWDFLKNEVMYLTENHKLSTGYGKYCQKWKEQFFILHENEEELNSIFIKNHDLTDELSPEVKLQDITILQDETFINDNNELVFKKDETIKQFISYSIGCMMGRYSLEKEGLILANQEDTLDQFKEQIPNPTFMPDEDGIIPFMGNSCNFSDDVLIRFKHFLEVAFSPDTLTENINFIQECLDMDLEKFLTDKFWQYHCKMYQKKPIYWLFSSPKGAFKVLVYMHRMNRFTVQKIRINYLLKHLSYLRNEIAKMEKNERDLSRVEAKLLDKLRSDEMECREYEILVKDSDKQESFDLDDGVSVNYAKYEKILAAIK